MDVSEADEGRRVSLSGLSESGCGKRLCWRVRERLNMVGLALLMSVKSSLSNHRGLECMIWGGVEEITP